MPEAPVFHPPVFKTRKVATTGLFASTTCCRMLFCIICRLPAIQVPSYHYPCCPVLTLSPNPRA